MLISQFIIISAFASVSSFPSVSAYEARNPTYLPSGARNAHALVDMFVCEIAPMVTTTQCNILINSTPFTLVIK